MDALLDDFFLRALLAGVGLALVAAPLGCFVVWRRLAYFGDTLSHAALLGVALALLLQLPLSLMVFVVAAAVALLLRWFQRHAGIGGDALLGMLAHGSLAIGLVVLSLMQNMRIDFNALLFGDILAVSRRDLAVIWGGGLVVLVLLAANWRTLFAGTVNRELAAAEGLPVERADLVFTLILALVIAMALSIVGVLLITALLIIPAAAARRLARSPEQMAAIAAIIGVLAVVAGLYGSLAWDTPSGPSMVVAALVLFLMALPFGQQP
ncbi:MAG: hypothetical protein CSB44_11745 [Gammaproteobacteria bacterium]|nr:MAG: hypothetical protein CSB44_11745 [Gammaproteobacteria bacterium]